jgi:hypothetical protein
MAVDKLKQALSAVDWNANVAAFLKDSSTRGVMAECNLRLAVWANQFEIVEKNNPALSFVREMQRTGHYVAALTALSLYKPAVAATRTVLESALYYTYFRSHPAELGTLVRDPKFFVQKSGLVEYHKTHTPEFDKVEKRFGLVDRLNDWYSHVSSVVHGEIPGGWAAHPSLAATGYDKRTARDVVHIFRSGEEIVHQLFLCTVGRELWDDFSSASKKQLSKGISGDKKAALGLDTA